MDDLAWTETVALPSEGELRTSGPDDARAVVLLVGGGTGVDRPGKWSTSMTWLAPRVRRGVGDDVRIGQVRYQTSSWNRLDAGIADVRTAIEHELAREVPPARIVLVALSMGGATCLAALHALDAPQVVGLVAMAPWFPEELPVDGLRGRRLFVIHGSLDNALPLVPGTSRAQSRRAVERARAAGADAQWQDLRGGLHGLAVRWRGRIWTLPLAGRFARHIVGEVVQLVRDPSVSWSRAAQ
jgi:predicted esterase